LAAVAVARRANCKAARTRRTWQSPRAPKVGKWAVERFDRVITRREPGRAVAIHVPVVVAARWRRRGRTCVHLAVLNDTSRVGKARAQPAQRGHTGTRAGRGQAQWRTGKRQRQGTCVGVPSVFASAVARRRTRLGCHHHGKLQRCQRRSADGPDGEFRVGAHLPPRPPWLTSPVGHGAPAARPYLASATRLAP